MSNKEKITIKAVWDISDIISIANATYAQALRYKELMRRYYRDNNINRIVNNKPILRRIEK